MRARSRAVFADYFGEGTLTGVEIDDEVAVQRAQVAGGARPLQPTHKRNDVVTRVDVGRRVQDRELARDLLFARKAALHRLHRRRAPGCSGSARLSR